MYEVDAGDGGALRGLYVVAGEPHVEHLGQVVRAPRLLAGRLVQGQAGLGRPALPGQEAVRPVQLPPVPPGGVRWWRAGPARHVAVVAFISGKRMSRSCDRLVVHLTWRKLACLAGCV